MRVDEKRTTWLHRYALLTAVATFLLVAAGALVKSQEAGLAVPDWPLSFGQLMPPMEGGVLYEHGHRMIGALVGLLTVGLTVWLWRSAVPRWLKRLGLAASIAVIVQGVLGGLTVLLKLPPAISISHAMLAQLFFSAIVIIVRATSAEWSVAPEPMEDTGTPPLKLLAWLGPPAIVVQLLLGAAYRHKVLGIVPHIAGALAVAALIFMTGIAALGLASGDKPLARDARRLLWLTGIQIVLGIAAYLSRILLDEASQPHPWMVTFTVAHVAVGALVLATSFVLAAETERTVRRAPAASAQGLKTAG
ncbi:MAG: COX15/CtaA family protein [Bryobacterales bacterium]|nr:COX15/CtaA family protein [Bryobacteraceae bacterium]MDW8130449.1 COX15/CtaA family protein [Bryobacterales bacterium]